MLETPQERVKLLKAGIDGKTIEMLYLIHNNFKIVRGPILLNQVDINNKRKKNVSEVHSKSNTRITEAAHIKIEQFSTNPIWSRLKSDAKILSPSLNHDTN